MTTYVPFAPSNKTAPPFLFQATLDGALYNVAVTWNFDAQRWYITITDQSNTQIVTRPLTASQAPTPLLGMSWANKLITAITETPMGFRLGSLVDIAVTGAVPAALSGIFPCTILGPNTFTYAADDPVQAPLPGSWSLDLNLIGGYFTNSTMVFRSATQNFEITP